MDIQFYGANCLVFNFKNSRFVVDDNLTSLGAKSVTREQDISLFTGEHEKVKSSMTFDTPGEYEVGDISIQGIQVRSHTDEDSARSAVIYKLVENDTSYLICGHIHPDLTEQLLEDINMVDVMFVPVGGSGYTLDPVGAQKIIRKIDPKIVVPTHYDDKDLKFEVPQVSLQAALQELSMEPKETVGKLKIKPTDLSDTTQLVVLQKS